MTRPEHLKSESEWLEHLARCARDGSIDPMIDHDDLAPARPVVWLIVAGAIVAASIVMALFAPAKAAEPELWGVVNTVSWHNTRECGICADGEVNQANWGAGLEVRFDHDLALGVGAYRNSFGRPTTYIMGAWQPIKAGLAQAGVFVGAATGYRNDFDCSSSVCPMGGLLFSVQNKRIGMNVMVVPAVSIKHTTVFGIQFKARVV